MITDLVKGITSQTAATVMLAAAVLLVIFFGLLYMRLYKKRSILMLFLANLMQLATAVLLYVEKTTGIFAFLMAANVSNVLLVTFLIGSFLGVFGIKTNPRVFLTVNATNLLQAVLLYFTTRNNYIVNLISAFIISFICLYGAIKMFAQRKSGIKKEVVYSLSIVTLFGILNLTRGVYRLFNPLYITAFSQIDLSAALFFVLSILFAVLLNLSALFLNFSGLAREAEDFGFSDSLSGVLPRNALMEMLSQKLSEIKRNQTSAAVVFVRLVAYKNSNAQSGHSITGRIEKVFAKTIKGCLRGNDIIGRTGDGEFIIILDAETDKEVLPAINRIKEKIEGAKGLKEDEITFSCGYMIINKEKVGMQANKIVVNLANKTLESKTQEKSWSIDAL